VLGAVLGAAGSPAGLVDQVAGRTDQMVASLN
jgi:hypothetical protein